MNINDFNTVVCKQFEKCMDTLCLKQGEYNTTDDRLDQFKKIAAFRGKHPAEVLDGMMAKHTSSVYDCIDRWAGGEKVGIGMWEEKITDHINYLVLLLGLVIDYQVHEANRNTHQHRCPDCDALSGNHMSWCQLNPRPIRTPAEVAAKVESEINPKGG